MHNSSIIGTTISMLTNSIFHNQLVLNNSMYITINNVYNNIMPLPYKSNTPIIYHGNNELVFTLENISG